jgi:hypothetical protein
MHDPIRMEGEQIPAPLDAFTKIAELALVRGDVPLSKFPACYEFTLAGEPEILVAVNGHETEREASTGAKVPAFHAYATWNGWPFALLNPFGGDFLKSPSRKSGSSERLLTMRLASAIRQAKEAKLAPDTPL